LILTVTIGAGAAPLDTVLDARPESVGEDKGDVDETAAGLGELKPDSEEGLELDEAATVVGTATRMAPTILVWLATAKAAFASTFR